jgi:benzoyl-CoA reductase/2-hydroxyglutaryl-CoA dehydratase subunit BcrC/BadD/HgdB
VVELSNQALEVKKLLDELRYCYPGIMHSSLAFKLFTIYNDLGKKIAVDVYTEVYQALQSKINTYEKKDNWRILWLGVLPLFKNRLLQDIEKRYNCTIVFEELFDLNSTPLHAASFYTDLSSRIVGNLFFSIENRLTAIRRYHQRFNIDGIIHFSQFNCKFLPPMIPVMRETLCQWSLPFTEIQGDAINPQYYSESRCYNQLDTFFETLNYRKGCFNGS